jgi:hypothetical protein
MADHHDTKFRQYEEEIEGLKQEIEDFKLEKERVRAIVGQIGGVPKVKKQIAEVILFITLLTCIFVSLITGGKLQIAMIEIGIALVSIKIMFMIRSQARVAHLQLWILSSLEWRLNDALKLLKEQNKPKDQIE